MSEATTPRLMAAAKEFNVGKDTLVDVLVAKGFSADEFGGNPKLSEAMYRVLQAEFQQDKVAKQKAEKVELVKTGGNTEPKKKKEDEDISFKKKEAPVIKVKEEKPVIVEEVAKQLVEEAPVVVPEPAPKEVVAEPVKSEDTAPPPIEEVQAITKIGAPELGGPKVVDKIDLSAIDSSTRPKKVVKKKEEPVVAKEIVKPVEEKQEEPPVVTPVAETPVVAETPKEEEQPVIENIKAEKLEGPKILGKIELPVDSDTRPKKDLDEKRKRKRIPIEKRGNAGAGQQQQGAGQGGGNFNRGNQQGGNRGNQQQGGHQGRGGMQQTPARGRFTVQKAGAARPAEKEIDQKEIQKKIQETQAKLAGSSGRGKSLKAKYRKAKREEMAEQMGNENREDNKLQVTEFISVSELASLMDVSFADVISKCMNLGIMVSINQRLEADVIELVASEFGFDVEFIGVDDQAELDEDEIDDAEEDLEPRAPIVTIMGHVDHGKTSLLDYIRNTNVIAGEAGGITQHIGAYEVTLPDGRNITFLDTPGHEAFTAMRARGAKVTDIAVIVVAADDAVMPQTKEAISHAQAASVPMIFAINKIDKDGANPEKIKEQLSGMNILVEDWGGKFQSQELSAKKGQNIDLLMEKILLEAEMLQLKANPERFANGTIIEASLDKGRGYVATILVQNGTLSQGDMIVSGQYFGKVKAMYNERNQRIETAPPSTPVLMLGLNGAPQAGETFKVYEDEAEAREVAYKRGQILREQGMRAKKHITLDEIGRRLALGNFKELNVIIKGDVDGSVEALSDSLQKLSTEEIVVRVIHKAVGAITESDVTLAAASDAIIIGFNVRPSMQAARLAENESIQIKLYSIIYNAIEEIRSAMEGMLEPSVEEKITANVEVKETYKFDKATVAGCLVLEGKILRNSRIRIIRDGIVVYPVGEGASAELASLKRYKDDVKEVLNNMECGLSIKNYNDLRPGDIVEAFEEVEVKRTL
jgi:translation initiation factor IF-2